MTMPVDISWPKTKKNVEEIVTKYVYFVLSVNSSYTTSMINSDFLLNEIENSEIKNPYSKIEISEIKSRIEFINYFINSFNKLTSL